MQYLERGYQELNFHTWTYYLVVTICSVGYGDISPRGLLGRYFAIFIILFAIISVPKQTNELIERMNRYSRYARASYEVRGQQKHVVLCGYLRAVSLKEFFTELFHEDHDNDNLVCVVLQTGE